MPTLAFDVTKQTSIIVNDRGRPWGLTQSDRLIHYPTKVTVGQRKRRRLDGGCVPLKLSVGMSLLKIMGNEKSTREN